MDTTLREGETSNTSEPTDTMEYDLDSITKNALELSMLSFKLEEKREQSLINQSSQMATAFAFSSAAVLMLLPVVFDNFSNIPIFYTTLNTIAILVCLVTSLAMALLVQWRYQYQALPSPNNILEHILDDDNINTFAKECGRNANTIKTLNQAWESKRKINDTRVEYIKASMLIFFAALGILLFAIVFGAIKYL